MKKCTDYLYLKDYYDFGWDSNLNAFNGPKTKIVISDEDETTDDIESRRELAEQMGWDEEEMDLEEFEDLFMNN